MSGWWVRLPGGRGKNTHQAMVYVDPGHDPLDARITKKSSGCSWERGCGKLTQKTNIRRPRIIGVVRCLCVRVRSSSGGSSERRHELVLTLRLRERTNCRRNLRSMCLIASSLNPFPPVVCVCFPSQERFQTKLGGRKTNLQYPGSPREQIFGNFRVIMVDLQNVQHPLG